ncbi:MAG: Rieske 2Fe-2S domain-containing protein [SAR202 cluster bacterium]|nr:Rieske 2Fe-2S domain-containing protein [SAR202 cluster bacterium]
MTTQHPATAHPLTEGDTPYHKAALGFRNYWYPALKSKEVTHRPVRKVLLGEPIAFTRRGAKVYAMIDECPHRGARMSLGKDEFPGKDTVACRFHGWTFDMANGGVCVAALTDGPDSPVVGKIRLRMYPVEERKGIVWIWMGKGAPAPLEDDVPHLLLREDTMVKSRHNLVYGNWRYHAEGSAGGHFLMLHRDAAALRLQKMGAYNATHDAMEEDDPVDGGRALVEVTGDFRWTAHYPGLGEWPPQRPWRFSRPPSRRGQGGTSIPVNGVKYITMKLPGYLRVRHFPQNGALYYEWYVPVDEDHYDYFQVSLHWPKNPMSWLWTNLWYYTWAAPIRKGLFNDQDKLMVRDNTDWHKRVGRHEPTPLYRPDIFPRKWIEFCNIYARGEGYADTGKAPPQAQQAKPIPTVAGGSGDEPRPKP